MTLAGPEIRRLLHDYGVRPRRSLGQNFVTDPNTVRRVVRLAGVKAGSPVVEVGAGLGSLTLALAEAGASVLAVEIDERLVAALKDVVSGRPVHVVQGDALNLDWSSVLARGAEALHLSSPEGPWTLVANLPYYAATPVVMRVLEGAPVISHLTVMVQEEVGDRFGASPGTAAYGAVTVKIAYWATAKRLGRVPATVFHPRPNVESVLVGIERRSRPALEQAGVSYEDFSRLVQAGFAQRRKTLRRALAGLVDTDAFAAADIDPARRAGTLDVYDWGRLAGVVFHDVTS